MVIKLDFFKRGVAYDFVRKLKNFKNYYDFW